MEDTPLLLQEVAGYSPLDQRNNYSMIDIKNDEATRYALFWLISRWVNGL